MIAVLGRKDINTGILRNHSDGGAGGSAGAILSEEFRNKCKQRTGDKNGFYGRTHSEETKAKMRAALKGRKAWNKGLRTAKKAAQGLV